MSTVAKQEFAIIQEDMVQLKSDLKGLTETLKELGKQKVAEAKGEAVDQADALLDSLSTEELRKHFKTLKAESEEALEAVRKQVEKYPAGTLLATLGAGIIIGKILSSGNKR